MAFLTEADIATLTGAKRPSAQRAVLKKNGIPFVERIDGKPVLTWEMVNSRPTVAQSAPVIDTSWMK